MPNRDKSTQEIADIVDVDKSTILNWIKLGLPSDKPSGKPTKGISHMLDVAEVTAWMKANNKTGQIGRPLDAAGNADLMELKIRKETALCLKYERENKLQDGMLIDKADEQKRDVLKITTLRNRLGGLGASIAPQMEGLDGPARQTLIDETIDNLLNEFGKK